MLESAMMIANVVIAARMAAPEVFLSDAFIAARVEEKLLLDPPLDYPPERNALSEREQVTCAG
jgi:hypothetical protein